MDDARLSPKDFVKIKKIEDVNVSNNFVIFVEKVPLLEIRGYASNLILLTKSSNNFRYITEDTHRDFHPRISPDESRVAFLSNRSGANQIHLMSLSRDEARKLTDEEKGVNSFKWSPDGSRISYVSRAKLSPENEDRSESKDPSSPSNHLGDPLVIDKLVYRTGTEFKQSRYHLHIFVIDVSSGNSVRITDGEFDHTEGAWISNSNLVTLSRRDEPIDLSTEYEILKFSGFRTSKGDRLGKVYNRSIDRFLPGPISFPGGPLLIPKISEPDLFGKVLHWTVLDTDGSMRAINDVLDRHIATIKLISADRAIVSIENEGKVELRELIISEKKFKPIISPNFSIESFCCTSLSDIYLIGTDPLHPTALYRLTDSGVELLYNPNAEFLSAKKLFVPENINLVNPEGIEYSGWSFDCSDGDKSKPPLVLSIHGGPDAMWNNAGTMWFEWQCFLSAGFSILALNPIGSGGYGAEFANKIRGAWGENDARDLLAAVDSVLDRVDPEKLYITGGSYAGFQTVNIISKDNRFRAACSQRGVYDLVTMLFATDIPLWYSHIWNGDIWEEENMLKLWRLSPLSRVKLIETPLLIIHSENDYRVAISQAEELFAALKFLKKEVLFIRYPREGHELSREGEPQHIIDRLERLLKWFEEH